jgi:hypothetical protein
VPFAICLELWDVHGSLPMSLDDVTRRWTTAKSFGSSPPIFLLDRDGFKQSRGAE